jgi:hypothetical protein
VEIDKEISDILFPVSPYVLGGFKIDSSFIYDVDVDGGMLGIFSPVPPGPFITPNYPFSLEPQT